MAGQRRYAMSYSISHAIAFVLCHVVVWKCIPHNHVVRLLAMWYALYPCGMLLQNYRKLQLMIFKGQTCLKACHKTNTKLVWCMGSYSTLCEPKCTKRYFQSFIAGHQLLEYGPHTPHNHLVSFNILQDIPQVDPLDSDRECVRILTLLWHFTAKIHSYVYHFNVKIRKHCCQSLLYCQTDCCQRSVCCPERHSRDPL